MKEIKYCIFTVPKHQNEFGWARTDGILGFAFINLFYLRSVSSF